MNLEFIGTCWRQLEFNKGESTNDDVVGINIYQ